jgi:hypothetical protein
MKSPFPGMDPYVESSWNDIHGGLVTYIRDELNALLPEPYRATMQKRVIVSDLREPVSGVRFPDVAVLKWPSGAGTATATAVHSQHLRVPLFGTIAYSDPIEEYSVEIIDAASGSKVITAIEMLSPDNKRPGNGMNEFREKQKEYREAGVNRCDIDLLRVGRRLFEFPESLLNPDQRKPYYVTIYRAHKPNEAELYAIDLRDSLPAIGIPLRPDDGDIEIALQPIFARGYRNARLKITYDGPCEPPLDPEDAAWAAQILANAKLK